MASETTAGSGVENVRGVPHGSRGAVVAVGAVFAINGLAIGAWAGVLPALRTRLGIDAGMLAVLLFIVGVGGIMIYGAAPLWFSLLVLVREVLVGGALVVLTALGMKRFDVSWWGKAGTLSLMVSFPAFLLADADVAVSGFMRVVAWTFGLPGLVLSYYAAITYVPLMRRNLAEGRAERRAAT